MGWWRWLFGRREPELTGRFHAIQKDDQRVKVPYATPIPEPEGALAFLMLCHLKSDATSVFRIVWWGDDEDHAADTFDDWIHQQRCHINCLFTYELFPRGHYFCPGELFHAFNVERMPHRDRPPQTDP